MAVGRVLFDVPTHKRLWKYGPPPKKVTRWIIHTAQFWRGNSMTHTKIIAVWAMVVRFLFWNRSRFVRQFSPKWCANCWNPPKNKGMCTTFSSQHWVHKTSLSLYFLKNFNNLRTILTRIVSQFWFFIQNQNSTTAACTANLGHIRTE